LQKIYKGSAVRVRGFGKNYFSLVAIQAYVSLQKVAALSTSVSTLSGKPLTIKVNSPPSA
jgi:hypothetical protein